MSEQDEQVRPALTEFEGLWRLNRKIHDPSGEMIAHLEGTMRYVLDSGNAVAMETGHLTIGGVRSEAKRTYLWCAGKDTIDVHFHDGRPFHRIDPSLTPTVTHDCAPDTYVGRYDFTAWPEWTLTWRVTGPAKDYESVSTFTRVTACGDTGREAQTAEMRDI